MGIRIVVITADPPNPAAPDGLAVRLYQFLSALRPRAVLHCVGLVGPFMHDPDSFQDFGLFEQVHVYEYKQLLAQSGFTARAKRLARYATFGAVSRRPVWAGAPPLGIGALGDYDLAVVHLSLYAHMACAVPDDIPVLLLAEEALERKLHAHLRGSGRLRGHAKVSAEDRAMRRMFRGVDKRVAGVVAINDSEQRWYQRYLPTSPIAVIDLGVDTAIFRPTDIDRDFDVVTLADFRFERNWAGLAAVLRAEQTNLTRRRGRLKWLIAGHGSDELFKRSPMLREAVDCLSVTLAGPVADAAATWQRGHVAVIPALEGTGTKTTLLQAMAVERPVVVSSHSARGVDITSGVHAVIVESASQAIDAVHRLRADESAALSLARAGRQLVLTRYDAARAADRFREVTMTMVSANRAAPVTPEQDP